MLISILISLLVVLLRQAWSDFWAHQAWVSRHEVQEQ